MGNLDSKLSQGSSHHYSIIEESSKAASGGSVAANLDNLGFRLSNPSPPLWNVKKVNYQNEGKNSLLFEFNHSKFGWSSNETAKKGTSRHLKLAQNQIKMLKGIRHPNIARYLFAEDNSHLMKCVLIVESMRPLSMHKDMSFEQLVSGIYGLTNALAFLHDKAAISHNNVNENSIYLNSKQVWKLSDFELALQFADLTKDNLRQIFEFRHKDSITPEEMAEFKLNISQDLDRFYKSHPHAIDSYSWAMFVKNLLVKSARREYQHQTPIKPHGDSDDSDKRSTTNSTTNIIDPSSKTDEDDDHQKLDDTTSAHESAHSLQDFEDSVSSQLEPFLSKDPSRRPPIDFALNLPLFEPHKHTPTGFDPFCLENLTDVEQNWPQLISYLTDIIAYENEKLTTGRGMKKSSTHPKQPCLLLVNEKLIDVLLKPFMFFSERVREEVFPAILVPKGERRVSGNLDHLVCLRESGEKKPKSGQVVPLEPFLDADKYKAFVLPRILSLFSMRSTQIRVVLLQYFPFYVSFITDRDALKYEVLPELLIGLKDKNDQLVSLTFSCLSIMVVLLGSEVVVGHRTNNDNKYFSDNIPKVNTNGSF